MDLKLLTKAQIKELEQLTDNVRKGIPIDFNDALTVIRYQEALKLNKKWWQFWK
jgi:hypothetical protein